MKSIPLQAPYNVERIPHAAAALGQPVEGCRFQARPVALQQRGIQLDPAASVERAGDVVSARYRVNGRTVVIEARAPVQPEQAHEFVVWVDAARCRADSETPHLVSHRALEVLGLDDLLH